MRQDDSYAYMNLLSDARVLNAAIENAGQAYLAFGFGEDDDDSRLYFDSLMSVMEVQDVCVVATGSLLAEGYGQLSFQRHFPKEAAVLDSNVDYTHCLLYPDGILCSTEALRSSGVRFDEELTCCRDELFAMLLSLRFSGLLYVPECEYVSGRVFDEQSSNTPQASVIDWYWELIGPVAVMLRAAGGGTLTQVAQYGMLYMLIQRYASNQNKYVKTVFADVDESQRFIDGSEAILKEIGDDILFRRVPATAWTRPRLVMFLEKKYGKDNVKWAVRIVDGKPELVVDNSDSPVVVERLGDVYPYVQGICLETDGRGRSGLRITARYFTCFPDDKVTLILKSSSEVGEMVCEMEHTQVYASRLSYFDRVARVNTLYSGFVPFPDRVCKQEITASARAAGQEMQLRIGIIDVGPNHIFENRADVAWHIPHYAVRSRDYRIAITPESPARRFVRELRYCKRLSKGSNLQKECAEIRKKYLKARPYFLGKRIWAYYDKGFKGGDNGEFAFRYAASQDDGIEHVYYIDPESRDGRKLVEEGYKVIRPGSMEGFLYALNSEVVFYTHIPAFNGLGIKKKHLRYLKDLLDPKLVRVYHGFMLTHDPSYSQQHMNAMATVVGSRYEHDHCTEPSHGWSDEAVIDSGMPRHDGLVPNNKRQLLFAPTWRPLLRTGTDEMGETLYNPEFKQSRYYKLYACIFADERLLDCAKRNGYKIKLFLHPRLAPQTVDFEPNDVFEALDCTKDSDYVTMMRESDLMVTDYSSVMVDFAYSRKPVVYYQDPLLPYWRHVDFDYKGIGFGEVCENVDDLIETLCDYMENSCSLKGFYRKRIDDFFYHDDWNNSKRLYDAVRKMTDR